MGRQEVVFMSHGERCAGWFYRAEGVEQASCVVMAHGDPTWPHEVRATLPHDDSAGS